MGKRKDKFEDYDAFVEKFKPKLTTDDCYTPPEIYDTVLQWIDANIMPLEGVTVVRPFWPGGDYQNHDYPEGCVVIDNPPFSIMAQITRFYHERGIRYFLFAPGTTLINSAKELDDTYIICGESVTFDNGASINISFRTNMDCAGTGIWVAGDLVAAIRETNDGLRAARKVRLPRYAYPMQVCSPAILHKIANRGISLRIPRGEYAFCDTLDSQREAGKSIYGGGWLISERAAAERAAAERAAAERDYTWTLSEREWDIIRSLGQS